MRTKDLPPLQCIGDWDVDELVPGYIVASAGHRFGLPSLRQPDGHGSQTGIDMWCVGAFLAGNCTLAEALEEPGFDKTQFLILAAFLAGMNWQRDRKRRQRMDNSVREGWARYREQEVRH